MPVFCTCNEACSVRIVENIEPTHLIIDEAAMATEPEAMIPIQLADHVTLIGDHMQLQVRTYILYSYTYSNSTAVVCVACDHLQSS